MAAGLRIDDPDDATLPARVTLSLPILRLQGILTLEGRVLSFNLLLEQLIDIQRSIGVETE